MKQVAGKYKQTKVGLIPSDWEVAKLGAIANIIGGGTPSSFINAYWNGDINWFTPTEIGKEKYSYQSIRKISKLGFENCSAKMLPVGTILLTTRAGIGDVSILMQEGCTNQGFQSFIVKNEIDNEYLYYLISTLKNVFLQNASGSTFLEISPNKIRAIQIPLPPTKTEQTAIATALSDADALINSLEKLIAKKRNIKQGAMQQLLKPKEGWEVKKLGEVCDIFKGKGISKSQISESGKYECILYGELFTTYKEVISTVVSKTNTSESIPSKRGDILYPGSTTTTGIDLAKASAILKDNVLLGGDIVILRRTSYDYNPIFLSYFLNEIRRNDIAQTTKGITIHHLYGKDLAGIYAAFPSIEEQNTIATILSDMDNEIQALETKLEKYRKVKLGMMQNLLTGKIRLV